MSAQNIRVNATVNEARTAAGHNKEQWDRFYFITKDEAKQLSETHPLWTRWILIPANEKDIMLQRINGRLSAEGIAPVDMNILKWRMSQLLRDIQRKYKLIYRYLAEGSMLIGLGTSTSPAHPQQGKVMQRSPQPQQPGYSPPETRPYDPIRDV
ncbi:hypothetical protein M011DRAFT_399317 [Sporormia fimetaria CBS 119925]|uniref:Uncharacterized protein n=1 Tax=Sporormia fimetaria CBS 119925 TaxID=1340428 RepID=A0A6A6VGQ2_9PLEO|nr:hypothetical protein M011DRAFT_399317 [Sporormia fimetaria CBS 119925]